MLVVPGAPFATQVWGNSHDEPLQVLGDSPWGVRDSIPLTPPETIRALDSVQRLFAAGRPSAGLADTLARQGISYVVVRNDLDPETSRSARPMLVHRAIEGSPGLDEGRRSSANRSAPARWRGSSPTAACDRAIPRWRSTGWTPVRRRTGAPYLVDTDAMARVDGGPEVLLRLDERRRLLGQPALGPMLLTADAQRAGWPFRRDGDRHRHAACQGNRLRPRRRPLIGDPGARRSAAHLQPGAGLSGAGRRHRSTGSGPAGGSRCRVRRRIRPRCPTSHPRPDRPPRSTATRRPAGCPTRCSPRSANGCRSTSTTRSPTPRSRSRPAPPPSARRSAVSRCRPPTAPARCASTRPGKPLTVGAAVRRDAVGADHRGCHRRRLAGRAVRHHRLHRHPVRRERASPILSACATPSSCQGRRRILLSRNGIWDRSCWAGPGCAEGSGRRCAARRQWRCRRRSR